MDNKKEEVFEEMKSGRSRKQDSEKSNRASNLPYVGIAAAAFILTIGAGIGFYFAKSGAYQETFMPNTTINGIAVAGMDVDEVKAMVEAELADYELKIVDRTGAGDVIARDEIGLCTVFDGGLEQILEMQEPMMWIKSLWTEVDYRIETMLVYDEELLAERVRALSCMDEAKMTEPENAYLSEYQFDTNSYEIVAPVAGTELVEDAVVKAIGQAVLELQTEVDLDVAECYTKPAVLADDPELVALANELNRYAGVAVTHRFGDIEEVLDGDTIHQWLTVDGSTVTFDESRVPEYVKELARKYNTAYEKRPFLTTYGDVVTIPGGSYGWRMNQTAETEAVLEAIREGVVRTREPEWLQTGASHGEYDYGDTYVEVNLTGQRLFFYKDGELLVECDFVSGNASRGWSTPAGIFPLTYKERNATLRGEDYATPVSYWMPFNGNIGLHDADWRASFGGAIFKTNGSHGCVNLPPKAAKIIYENISKGDPVICYHLEGTDTKATSKAGEINTSGVASVVESASGTGAGASAEGTGGSGSGAGVTKPTGQGTTKPAESKPAETTPTVPESTPAETTPAVPENASPVVPGIGAVETVPVAPEGAQRPETAPIVPEGVQSPETAPVAPEGVQSPETAPSVPEGVQVPGTTPSVPEGAQRPESVPTLPGGAGSAGMNAVPGGALTETRPAGQRPSSGPGSSAQIPGPGNSGNATGSGNIGSASGPGSTGNVTGPGSTGNIASPGSTDSAAGPGYGQASGPGYSSGTTQAPMGPGYGG